MVVAGAKIVTDTIIIIHVREIWFFFTRFELQAHKSIVKWVPCAGFSLNRWHATASTNGHKKSPLKHMGFNLHLPLDKMAAISQTTFSNAFSWMKSFVFWIRISLKFVLKVPIDNTSAWVQGMAWHQTGYKPLTGPMLAMFTDAYMQHLGEMS